MNNKKYALVLIGFQNDYFAKNGLLHGAIEASSESVLSNTLDLLRKVDKTDMPIISTPIYFTSNYEELVNPVGILNTIKAIGAFDRSKDGSKVISEIEAFGDRIITIEGKRGLNAFHLTHLDETLKNAGATHIVLAGVVTSICIDSTARSATEMGYEVIVLCDCTAGRTSYEQEFYCSDIFPLYARIMNHNDLLGEIGIK